VHQHIFLPTRGKGRWQYLGDRAIGVIFGTLLSSPSSSWLRIFGNGERGDRALSRRSARCCWFGSCGAGAGLGSGRGLGSPARTLPFEVARHVCVRDASPVQCTSPRCGVARGSKMGGELFPYRGSRGVWGIEYAKTSLWVSVRLRRWTPCLVPGPLVELFRNPASLGPVWYPNLDAES
jgi:hypothetical protein